MLFETLYEGIEYGGKDKYFVQGLYDIVGKLDICLWKKAWDVVIHSNESLRASFLWDKLTDPLQVIHKKVDIEWKEFSYKGDKDYLIKEKLDSLLKAEREIGFNLNKPILMRFNLIEIDENRHYFVWNKHHIIIDGWSLAIILSEVNRIYHLLVNKKEINLLQRRSYRDYIIWLKSCDQAQAKSYWNELLNGCIQTKIGRIENSNDGECKLKLDKIASKKLKDLSSSFGITMSIMIQAIWSIVLSKLTMQKDVVFGITISGRQIDLPDVEDIIGIFINTIPLRVRLKSNLKFKSLLELIKDSITLSQNYGYISLADIQRDQNCGGDKLFDNILIYENYPSVQDNSFNSDILIKYISSYEKTGYALTITVIPYEELEFRFNYDGYFLSLNQVESIVGMISQLIKNILHIRGDACLGDLLITKGEDLENINIINKSSKKFDCDKNLNELFQEKVKEIPDSISTIHKNIHLTYNYLDKKSSELASYLTINYKILPSQNIATILTRSNELTISILAIVKIGCAVLALDPEHPIDKLKYQIVDSKANLVIINQLNENIFCSLNSKIISYDFSSNKQCLSYHIKKINSSYPSHIVYSSGSTGFPKGIALSHTNIVNRIKWMIEEFPLDKNDVLGQKTTQSFVDFISEIWGPLITGIKSVIIEREDFIDLEKFSKFCFKNYISYITAIPSFLEVMLDSGYNFNFNRVILSGEKSSLEIMNRVKNKFSELVLNLYGSSEISADSLFFNFNEKTFNTYDHDISIIGKAIGNTVVYILDEEMNLVPLGSRGELYIGGLGVSHGYVNKADLTSERFVANPFRREKELELGINGRLYRTGDIGRYLEDGKIEYIGRNDFQVKIRGYRVELGEIESRLRKHGDVKECVVCEERGELIAYIVYGDFKADEEEIRRYLEEYLPGYMIPNYYVEQERMPLTSSGKLDRKSLKKLDEISKGDEGRYVEPEEGLEKELCEIWEEVLGREKVGVEDNFFKLGGHSLLAIKLISRVRKRYDIEIKLMSLFDKPRVRDFKIVIENEVGKKGGVKIERVRRLEERPVRCELSFGQQRLWFIDKLLPEAVIYNMPVALELRGDLDREALRESFEKIVERHEILRTIFKEDEFGEAYQEIRSEVEGVYEEIDIRLSGEKEFILEEYKEREASWKFRLDEGPLCRVKLIVMGEGYNVLLITMHHIVSDGWSLNILFEELSKLYGCYIRGEEAKLKEQEIQYVDYSIWQRKWLSGENLKRQLDYWKKKLEGIPAEIGLPTDRPRPKELTYKGGHHYFELSDEVSIKIKEICEKEGVSVYMVLLTALNVLLYKLSGNSDIVVGSPVSGRHYEEIEGLIGFFVNTLVVRNEVKGGKSFRDLLVEVRENSLESYQYQDIPFEKLVDALDIERSPNKNPIFQVMIDVKNLDDKVLHFLDDLKIKNITNNYDVMKFELEFVIYQKNEKTAVRINYLKDLYIHDTIIQLSEYYKNIIQSFIKNINESIGNISILKNDELLYQTDSLNPKIFKNEKDKDYLAHQLFEQRAIESPDSIAVIEGDNYLTYLELNNRANMLANYLVEKGMSNDFLIGFSSVRSINCIISILGILKSGGVYLPIDIKYPDERIMMILSNSGINYLITTNNLECRFKKLFKGEVICIENINYTKDKELKILNQFIHKYTLAYVIYTSGTTGKPKGVMITHDALTARLRSLQDLFKLTKNDKIFQQASLSFDVSLQEILCTLTSGATLCIMKEGLYKQTDKLLDSIRLNQVTVVEFIPSFLLNLLSIDDFPKNLSLKKVIVGGEPITKTLIEIFKEKLDIELINMCGPTEVCMDSTYWVCDSYIPKLGKPLNETSAYILDRDLNIVPFGQIGELYFSSKAIGRGYIGLPCLTAEKFIANLFTDNGDRLYRSGDIVRWLPDGNLDYLGRKDFQVKIRGFRVEIEEIEKILDGFSGINQKIIIVKKHQQTKNNYLVCYYSGKYEIDSNKIIEYLSTYLPEYMVPSLFVFLSEMPVSINGKIDRNSLPDYQFFTKNYYSPPKNKIEMMLCEIWQEVLGIDKVGIKDNFFRLGGDSIITIQILSKSKNRGIIFNLKDIFDHPQIDKLSKLCKIIEPKINDNSNAINKKIFGSARLIPIQDYFFKANTNWNHYNQSIILSFNKSLNINLLKQALEQIIEHHDILRAKYKIISTEQSVFNIQQMICKKVSYTFDYYDLSGSKNLEFDINKSCNAIHKKINIFTSNLVGVGALYLSESLGYRIFIAIHHLVVDEVSWRIIKEDLEIGYNQLLNKEKIKLYDKTTSYKEWSSHLKKFLKVINKDEISFWQKIEEKIEENNLEQKIFGKSKDIKLFLSKEKTLTMLRNVNQAYKTDINDILLSSLNLVLNAWRKSLKEKKREQISPSMIIDLEGHGREDLGESFSADLSRTVGWFTTVYPLDIEIQNNNKDLSNLIKEIKERIRSLPKKGLGYGVLKLYGKLSSKFNIRSNGILFNYLSQRLVAKSKNVDSEIKFNFSSDPKGSNLSEDNNPSHGIVINCGIYDEIFSIRFTYDSFLYSDDDIKFISNNYILSLEEIIAHCSDKKNFGYTPTDFKQLPFLTQEFIDQKLSKIENIEDAYPLSPLQSGFLFTEVMSVSSDESMGYIVQSIYQINSNISIEILKASWDILIQNNQILRTGFLWDGLEEPIQFVVENCNNNFDSIDLCDLDDKLLEPFINDLANKEKLQNFNLAIPPLNRVLIVSCSSDKSYMIWTTHHIISDGWSSSILIGQLKKIYNSLIKGEFFIPNNLIVYKDYINWINTQNKPEALDLWCNYLEGLDQDNSLQFNYNNSQKLYKGSDSSLLFEIDESLLEKFKNTAFLYNVTLNNLFQAVFGIVLYKYTQLKDFTFGITVSGRSIDLDGVEDLIGLTINTLPLRININKNKIFKDFLQDLRDATLFINKTSYISLAEVQKLAIKDKEHLFNTIFVYENYPHKSSDQGIKENINLTKFGSFSRTEYPFNCIIYPGNKFVINLAYNSQSFSQEFIKEFRDSFVAFIEIIIKNSNLYEDGLILGQLINTYDSRLEKKFISENFEPRFTKDCLIDNNTRIKNINELFEESVERVKDSVAVIYEDKQLTYKEVNERANQLGHYLKDRYEIKADDLIGLCLDRSENMIIAILAIMKAGGAYVPMDPGYPDDRIGYILKDTGSRLVIVDEIYEDRLKSIARGLSKESHDKKAEKVESRDQTEIAILSIDSNILLKELKDQARTNLEQRATSNNLAYVIYTSGTTGNPKGVMIEHGGILNTIRALKSTYDFSYGKKSSAFTSYVFDVSVSEFFIPLLSDATLYFLDEILRRDINKLSEYIEKNGINYIYLPPVLLSQLPKKNYMQLKSIIYAGEACQSNVALKWCNEYKLYNYYGPTEVSIYALEKQIIKGDTHIIGQPIDNVICYILDDNLSLVPVGVIGELYIGGVGVARGYVGRGDLTAEKFIANPFRVELEIAEGRNGRLYRSGDLVRWLPDGNIEYIGRNDFQVKIRGYRIELGEIENQLIGYEGVSQAVVIAKDSKKALDGGESEGTKYLVGYYVSEERLDEIEILKYLESKLPDYIVPSVLVYIDKLPLTVNGKLDRKTLPDPEFVNENNYVGPRNEIEKKLCEIWAEVLGIETNKIGIKDNFFRLGGHSINLMRVVSLMRSQGFNLPITFLFQNATIRQISLYIFDNLLEKTEITDLHIYFDKYTSDKGSAKLDIMVPITFEGAKMRLDKLFIIHPGSGIASYYLFLEKYLNNCVFGLNNPNFYNPKVFKNVEQIARLYLKEITKIQPLGPYNIAGFSFGAIVAYEISRIIYKETKKISNIILMDPTVDFTKAFGDLEDARYSDDEIINYKINQNLKHFDSISEKYNFKRNKNNILFLKNKKNAGSLNHLCKFYKEIIIPGTHATFLTQDTDRLSDEINNFLSNKKYNE